MTVAAPSGRGHAFPGAILMGAQSRLIPYHIPLRFFAAAAVFQVVAWLLLAAGYGGVAGFNGGPGLVLAALHALTLGVLVMTAMGASYQLLSVATGVAMKTHIPCRLSSWLYIPGSVLLVAGMAYGDGQIMLLGGGLTVAGLVVFSLIVGDMLRRTVALKITVRHVWGAIACLALLTIAGLSLITDFKLDFLGSSALPDHANLAIGHAILGGFGFMGLLTLGFSYVLVPMFALSPAPDEKLSMLSLGFVVTGLAVALAGALAGDGPVIVAAAVIGLAGVIGHLWLMAKALREGMKKRLGLSFVLVRAGWLLLLLAIVLGGLAAMGLGGANLPDLFGFILVFGWLLTFMTGVLQRILPFLTSMHAHKLGRRAPRLAEMGSQGVTLKMHAVCHGLALALVSSGIIANVATLVLAGALVGSLGAAAFLWFTFGVGRHVVAFYNKNQLTEQP